MFDSYMFIITMIAILHSEHINYDVITKAVFHVLYFYH